MTVRKSMMMKTIAPDDIIEARKIDLLTYLSNCEPQELVHLTGNVYTTKEHDSLKISNGKWMWWSRGIGGCSALDYLIKVRGMKFPEAVKTVLGRESYQTFYPSNQRKAVQKVLLLPDKSPTNDKVREYLEGRGIDLEIIDECLKGGIIYESLPYHNAVFLGMDESNVPRYAAYRATNERRLMGEASGSDKNYSFKLLGQNKSEVHIFESAIDALSYATLLKIDMKEWKDFNLISLAGVYATRQNIADSKVPSTLKQFLKLNSEVRKIYLHLDNDFAGRNAAKALCFKLSDEYEVIDNPVPKGKDVNDFLLFKKGIGYSLAPERRWER